MMFTTRLTDNDIDAGNCADSAKGAFWYFDCLDANPLGSYGSTNLDEGVIWSTYRGREFSLDSMKFLLR